MSKESLTNFEFQRTLITSYISHAREVMGEEAFPADAKLSYERAIQKIEMGLTLGDGKNTSLDDTEIALRKLCEDIDQFWQVSEQTDRKYKTNSSGLLQNLTRSFSGIWRK